MLQTCFVALLLQFTQKQTFDDILVESSSSLYNRRSRRLDSMFNSNRSQPLRLTLQLPS